MKPHLILASSSPRRRDLMAGVGLQFNVVPSAVPEIRSDGERPKDYVTRLSRDKAGAVAKANRDRWIVAADTIVVCDDEVLEKPVDAADAKRMLATISGRSHLVHTGLTLQHLRNNYRETEVCTTTVRMISLTEQEIAWYVNTGEPLDKAGAYAAQGIGGMFIDSIEGSFTNVVGLPLALLLQMLRQAGIDPLQ